MRAQQPTAIKSSFRTSFSAATGSPPFRSYRHRWSARGNFWPGRTSTTRDGLNHQARAWCEKVSRRTHALLPGTVISLPQQWVGVSLEGPSRSQPPLAIQCLQLERARAHLETPGLNAAVAVLESRLETASKLNRTYGEVLADLMDAEVRVRRDRYAKARTRLAHLPFHESLQDFDFSFQPLD